MNKQEKPQDKPPFLYAEECGLALMKNQATGKKFWIEKETWSEVVSSVQAGWQPWKND